MSRKVAGIEDSRKTALGNWNKVSKYMYNLGRHQLVNINGSQVGNIWCLSRGLCAPLHRGAGTECYGTNGGLATEGLLVCFHS